MSRIKFLSLFTGAGGLDLGFVSAGFKPIAAIEIESSFCETLNKNKGKFFPTSSRIINEDIKNVNVDSEFKKAEFILGGPPCQAFSAAARRLGGIPRVKSKGGGLFENYCHMVSDIYPKGFLFENVRGLLYANRGKAWNIVQKAFSMLGYNLFWRILDTAHYGVPQRRERLILVGTRGRKFLFPKPTHGPHSDSARPYKTCWDAIKDLQDPNEPRHKYGGKYGHLLSEIPEGMNYSYFTQKMGHPNPAFAWRSRFHDFLYKIHRNKPVRTIQAKPGKFSGPFHWKNRRLTIQELKRLQTFPDDFEFAGSKAKIVKQIGNSVPPLFAEKLARAVAWQLFGKKEFSFIKLMPEDYELDLTAEKRKDTKRLRKKIKKKLKGKEAKPNQASIPLLESKKGRHFTFLSQLKTEFHEHPTLKNFTVGENSEFPRTYRIATCYSSQSLLIKAWLASKGEEIEKCWEVEIKTMRPINGIKKIKGKIFDKSEVSISAIWELIQQEIRRRTSLLSLVDFYGHFAERRPGREISVKKSSGLSTAFSKIIHFFSHPNHCGKILKVKDAAASANLPHSEFLNAALPMRKLRYDMRSSSEKIFCGYPFPSLNRRFQLKAVPKVPKK